MLASFAGAQNLIQNPTFDNNVAGWYADNGVGLFHDPTDGDSAPGCALASTGGTVYPAIFQCVNLAGLPAEALYDFGASLKPVVADSSLFMDVIWYDDSSCSGSVLPPQGMAVGSSPTVGQWNAIADSATAPAGAQSAHIGICHGILIPDGEVRIDDVWLMLSEEIFSDGFETGDTSEWSGVVP
jgi:hypothetical protein